LNTTIKSFHYGNPKITVGLDTNTSEISIGSSYSGTLDMRAGVGHLTRNIKIYGTAEDGWGGHL